jgi:hypothetical protein
MSYMDIFDIESIPRYKKLIATWLDSKVVFQVAISFFPRISNFLLIKSD